MVIIYLLANEKNKKRYIGITRQSLSTRFSKHWNAAKSGRKTRIAAAIRKYGRSVFSISIIEELSDYKAAQRRERELIHQMSPEYNVTLGGEGVLGIYVTQETRNRLSDAAKGRKTFLGKKHSAESIEKMRAAALGRKGYWTGKTRDVVSREKMRQAAIGRPGFWKGKIRSPETIEKIRKSKAAR